MYDIAARWKLRSGSVSPFSLGLESKLDSISPWRVTPSPWSWRCVNRNGEVFVRL